jgi:hypothetical protein
LRRTCPKKLGIIHGSIGAVAISSGPSPGKYAILTDWKKFELLILLESER